MTAMSTNPAGPSSLAPLVKTTLTPRSGPRPSIEAGTPAIEARDFRFSYGAGPVLKGITFTIPRRAVTAIIGPSGCGKSTFLRSINRMHDLLPGASYGGDILLEGKSIFGAGTDLVSLRLRVGMVFQRPNPFPKSIYDNVAYGPGLNRLVPSRDLPDLVERCLTQAALWSVVEDRQDEPRTGTTGRHQQR